MRTVRIGEISATLIREAAAQNEPLALTKDNVVCGVLIPVSPRWVQEVVHRNLSRIVHSIQLGEKELANAEPFVTLEEPLAETTDAPTVAALRRVSIRRISGKLISDAAETGEPFAITSDNVLHGVVIPVSARWLQEIVDSNLSRVVRSIRLGERELVGDDAMRILDDVVKPPNSAVPAAASAATSRKPAAATSSRKTAAAAMSEAGQRR